MQLVVCRISITAPTPNGRFGIRTQFELSSYLLIYKILSTESGRLEFEEFVTLAAKFIVEEDDEAMQKELKEAFRLYDKEGKFQIIVNKENGF